VSAGRDSARSSPRRGSGPAIGTQVGAIVGAVAAAFFATQFVAARLGYHPNLGPWLYRLPVADRALSRTAAMICGVASLIMLATHRWRWNAVPLGLLAAVGAIAGAAPLYSPTRVAMWYGAYRSIHAYDGVFLTAGGIFCGVIVVVTVAATRLACLVERPVPQPERRAVLHALPRLPVSSDSLDGPASWRGDTTGDAPFDLQGVDRGTRVGGSGAVPVEPSA
jgi:hypothetical protein